MFLATAGLVQSRVTVTIVPVTGHVTFSRIGTFWSLEVTEAIMGENIGSNQTSANFIRSKQTSAKLLDKVEHSAINASAILAVVGLSVCMLVKCTAEELNLGARISSIVKLVRKCMKAKQI